MCTAPRGAIAIWAVLVVGVLLAFGAVVLNAGHLTTVKGELQNGVDAAALAGALQLRGTTGQLTEARDTAHTFGAYHHTDHSGDNDLNLKPADVILGEWRPAFRPLCEPGDRPTFYQDTAGGHFCAVTETNAAAAFRINAVYARARRAAGNPGGPVPILMSALLGRGVNGSVDQAAEALAISGGPIKWDQWTPGRRCVPMVVGVGCIRDDYDAACPSDAAPDFVPADSPKYTLGLSPGATGWLVSDGGGVCEALQTGSACMDLRAGAQVDVRPGDAPLFDGGCGGTTSCDVTRTLVGQTIDVPTVSASGALGEACPNSLSGQTYVVGFTAMEILAVKCSSGCSGGPNCADLAPCTSCLLARMVCNHKSDARAGTGGAWTGSSTYHPILVQTRGAAN